MFIHDDVFSHFLLTFLAGRPLNDLPYGYSGQY
ncbi:hypothetical protein SAMN04488104_10636 [Algoriphagus faecimaris]|uniref:Uncharacterized protein n=1 Tax=Algoriphagus faecimaris TaxID=686796 RepID=A0A1G6XNM6_9BACT|nr:hypothetical protein SAMN04488104_10636 [Algoriphagus faecimaris]